jgi:hypothetical protein
VVHPRVDGDVRQREDGHEDEVGRDDLGRRLGRGEEAAEPDERVSRTTVSTAVAGALGPAVTTVY